MFRLVRRYTIQHAGQTFTPLHATLVTRAEAYISELSELEKKMADGFNIEDEKKYSRISAIVDTFGSYKDQLSSVTELQEMLADKSLAAEAEEEMALVLPELVKTAEKLHHSLLPPHEFADKPCILELRPGVGGSEAALFTTDLLNMYIGYCLSHRWAYECTPGSHILTVNEPGSYNKLRFESGVHRVQRIPATEAKGRVHTSTAAVVVLPKMEEVENEEINFAPDEIRIDIMRASGKGGQHVNTTDSAVRLTHFPSGIVISMQDERSQHKNKAKAFAILRARLAEKQRLEKLAEEKKIRKDQVSTTDRSDKIRTYNFPQNRITDHRIGWSLHDIPGFMKGERLDEAIEALEKHENEEKSKDLLLTVD